MASHWKGEHQRILQLKATAWAELQRNMLTPRPAAYANEAPARSRKTFWWALSAAASVLLLLAAAWLFRTTSNDAERNIAAAPELIIRTTELGQKLTIRLADGSQVKLNAGSRLVFPETFAGHTREVELEGEAFFEVAHNPARPFIVHSRGVVVEVKGTSFNVSSYADNNQKIAVLTGLVQVSNHQEKLLVEPGQLAVSKGGGVLSKRAYLPEEIAWKDGLLVFKQADMADFEQKIKYWYGFTLRLQSPVATGQGFTGTYDNPSLKTVMQSFAFATGAEYEIDYATKTVTVWQKTQGNSQ